MQLYQEAGLMPADLFQTQYGGWFSNLSWDIKFLMAMMLLMQLEDILLNRIPWDSICLPEVEQQKEEAGGTNSK